VNEGFDAERSYDADDTQRRYHIVDDVTGEHCEPVGGRLDATDVLTMLGA